MNPAWLGMVAIVLAGMLLSACGPGAAAAQAHANKQKLDHELAHARNDLGIPDIMLAPVTTQEQQVAAGDGGWGYNYQDAAQRYAALYTQLTTSIEPQSGSTVQQKTQHDIDAFATALNERRAQGFNEAAYYQTRLDDAMKALATASTPGDYAKIDAAILPQIAALHAMWPAYQRLQDFKALLRTLRSAGVDSALGQQQEQQDEQAFRDPSTADYAALQQVIDGQTMQIMADQTEALPYVSTALLGGLQARIDLLHQYGDNPDAATLQQQHDADAKLLAKASQLTDYLSLAQTINAQTDAVALPLARGQAQHDLATLMSLIAQGKSIRVGGYAADYEYADRERGYGDAANEVHNAQTLDDYLTADDDVNILITNLRALLDNLNDPTPHNQAHQADLQLLQHYGAIDGRAIVVSLREQTARFYENGQLVYTSVVTTGRPEKPSPPGLHYAMYKQTHMLFTSPDPAGSPLWYAPTPVNYGILYANYGFFLHDAWWRRRFGPGSNLPHYDPAAFDGGSHGCINFPESNMAWVYNWTPVGSPIIVY
jgi:L,D-transpeptidase catalytic domain